MKIKSIVALVAASTTAVVFAAPQVYQPDSLIIPMDTTYQDNGMFEAYGLVYQLLLGGVPVDWTIEPGKAYEGTDFIASALDLQTGTSITDHPYSGGPFVVRSSDYAAALPIVQAWQATHPNVAVHRATLSFSGEVGRSLLYAPTIAVFSDGKEDIAFRYLNAAAIQMSNGSAWPPGKDKTGAYACPGTYCCPDCLTPTAVAGTTGSPSDGALFDGKSIPRYCQIMSMHYSEPAPVEVVEEVRAFLGYQTHLFAECQAVDAFENNSAGHFLTSNGLFRNGTPTTFFHFQADDPFAQAVGGFAYFKAGSEPSYALQTGSLYHNINVVMLTGDTTTFGVNDIWMNGRMDDDPAMGKVSYLGGHEYDSTLPISANPQSQGIRYFLNSLYEAPCTSPEGAPSVSTTPSGPTFTAIPDYTVTVCYENTGPGIAFNATNSVTLPAGATFVAASGGGNLSGNTVTWDLGSLPPGASACETVQVTFTATGTYDFTTSLSYQIGLSTMTATGGPLSVVYDTTAPPAPNAPSFTNVGCTSVTVTWPTTPGATSYSLYRIVGPCGGTATLVSSGLTGTSYADTGLTALTQYSYYLVATNVWGDSPPGSCSSVTTTTFPDIPTGLAASVVGSCGDIALTWNAAARADTYNVYRGTSCGTATVLASGIATTSYTDTTANPGVVYRYAVEAVNPCGPSGPSSCIQATGGDTTPPTFAGIVSAAAGFDALSINLAWAAGSDACGGVSYNVYRGLTSGGVDFTTPVASGINALNYTDSGLIVGQQYCYAIRAVDAAGNEESNTVVLCATPAPCSGGGAAGTGNCAALGFPTSGGPVALAESRKDQTKSAGWELLSDLSSKVDESDAGVKTNDCDLATSGTKGPNKMKVKDKGNNGSQFLKIDTGIPLNLTLTGPPLLRLYASDDKGGTGGCGGKDDWTAFDDIYVYDYNGGGSIDPASLVVFQRGVDFTVQAGPAPSTPPSTGTCGTLTTYIDLDLTALYAAATGTTHLTLRLIPDAGDGLGSDGGVEIKQISEMYVQWEEQVAAGPTSPTVISPNGGENLSGVITISWTAATGTAPITYDVYASTDGGATYGYTVGTGLTGTTTTWDTVAAGITTTTTALIRIVANDGKIPSCNNSDASDAVFSITNYVPPPKEASPPGLPALRLAKGAGTSVDATYAPGCGSTDHMMVWGQSPIASALNWTTSACGLGNTGTANFDPGDPPPGTLFYFVIVAQNSAKEGSYGRDSNGVERPEASGFGTCDLPQDLTGTCP